MAEIGSRLNKVEKRIRSSEREGKFSRFINWSTVELVQAARSMLGLTEISGGLQAKVQQINVTGKSRMEPGALKEKLLENEVIDLGEAEMLYLKEGG